MPKTVNRQIIAVDIDDVLAEHIEEFIRFSNSKYGTGYSLEDYLEQWADLWRISHREVVERAVHFHTDDIVGNFAIIKDALDVLKQLKDSYELVIVTARPKGTVETTHRWVDANFPGIFSEIHFVPIWDPGPKVTKAQICKRIGANYLIDDLVRHCNLAAEVSIQAVLFNRIKWKQPEDIHKDVVVVNDWQEVLEYFNAKN